MNIQAINTQTFGAKKFRLPVKSAVIGHPDAGIAKRKVNWVKEYENPNAEALWNQAMKETSMEKKLSLIEAMGEYKLIDLEQENYLARAFKEMQNFLNKSEK